MWIINMELRAWNQQLELVTGGAMSQGGRDPELK
jgi:hypothetical protein